MNDRSRTPSADALFPQEPDVTHAVFGASSRCRGLPIQSPAMKIGYGRVSTRDQNPDAQRDALAAAGCDQVFIDKASGKLARPPRAGPGAAGRPGR